MNSIQPADMVLVRASCRLTKALWRVAHLESILLGRALGQQRLEQPIFICGLARSGSTMLLELLARVPGVATSRYSDFPFVAIPWLWNKYQMFARYRPLRTWPWKPRRTDGPSRPRPHQDGIQISSDSPEAMDEPLWRAYAPCLAFHWNDHAASAQCARESQKFATFFECYLRKVMLIRSGQRLVAKNNYHVARMGWLAEQFDANFVVPIRHPVSHVASLVRQHHLFVQYAQQDRHVADYLRAAAHFEFGPQRMPFTPSAATKRQIEEAWRAGDDALGYAWQWQAIYAHVACLMDRPELSNRIHLVPYETFCKQPAIHWRQLCAQLNLAGAEDVSLDHVSTGHSHSHYGASARPGTSWPLLTELDTERVWSITGQVAAHFGYSPSA